MATKLAIVLIHRRQKTRRKLIQAIYQWLMNQDSTTESLIRQFWSQHGSLKNTDKEFFQKVLDTILNDTKTITDNFVDIVDIPFKHLDPVEKAILLLASYELEYEKNTPSAVITNEAIDLAKLYGAEQSHKFINATLDKAAKIIRKNEKTK
ncbi:MAG: transcription antitermination factor NusB [Gammaproteobacteria bacterium]|nr:MAG: transcription antitermination factor NusB [Gammaproteobacteria bacterium]